MDKEIQNKNVFIDTEIFISNNFQYFSKHFDKLLYFLNNSEIKLFLTDITKREIESHIKSEVDKVTNTINSIKSKGYILRNCRDIDYSNIFQFSKTDTEEELIEQFYSFIKKGNIEILSTKEVSIDTVFDKYFTFRPPFNKKKKEEFPDAFSFESILLWCEENGEKMYVISGDPDWEAACDENENVFYLNNLQSLFKLLAERNESSDIAESILKLFNSQIEKKTIDEFERLGFYLKDEDGEVLGINVTTIDEINSYLIDIDDKEMIFEIEYDIEYEADIEYNNYDESQYDKETDEYLFIEKVEETVTEIKNIEVQVTIKYNKHAIKESSLESVTLFSYSDIGVPFRRDSEWPYK